MKVAKEGLPFIMGSFLLTLAGGVLSQGFGIMLAGTILSFLGMFLTLFCAYFFRDPDRPLPSDSDKIYSPGDGRVLSVAREGKKDGPVTLRIFLSIFDVHVQRIPFSGIVEKIDHKPGSFKAAMANEARYNERSILHLSSAGGREPLVFEQIAGLIARRIVCWAKKGQVYAVGERYGLIRFGSQAAVHFPPSARCTVKPGDKVFGGITVIGEWIEKP